MNREEKTKWLRKYLEKTKKYIFDEVNLVFEGLKTILKHDDTNELCEQLSDVEFDIMVDTLSIYEKWRMVDEFNRKLFRDLLFFLYTFHCVSKRIDGFNSLHDLRYIQYPDKLFNNDIASIPYVYFKTHAIDKLIIVRKEKTLYCGPEDLTISSLTNGGNFKIIENERATDRSKYDENIVWELYKQNPSKQYLHVYDEYMNIPKMNWD